MDLSIVIPALNEEKTIGICVRKAVKSIQDLGIEGEVVVADNGSTDNTRRIAEQAGARVAPIAGRGYGAALMGGFHAARGRWLIMADADDSYNFEEIAPYVQKLKEGYDFVVGNRFKGKIEKDAMPFLHRFLGTPVLTGIMNVFFSTGIGDTNCGMRGLTKRAFLRMRLRAMGMEFATEMIVKASILKLKIAEVPCNLYKDKRDRKPHLNTWVDGWRHLRFMLLFSPAWTFLVPAFVLMGLGAAGMLALSVRDFVDPQLWMPYLTQKHILSFMLLFILGSQVLGMGLVAEAFSFSRHFDRAKRSIQFLNKYFRLEKGILIGGGLLLASVAGFAYLFISYLGWLPSPDLLKRFDLAACFILAAVLGAQIIFTSFLLSLFYLKVK